MFTLLFFVILDIITILFIGIYSVVVVRRFLISRFFLYIVLVTVKRTLLVRYLTGLSIFLIQMIVCELKNVRNIIAVKASVTVNPGGPIRFSNCCMQYKP